MRSVFVLLVLSAISVCAAPPTDNPIATFYSGPGGYPAWTNKVQWANVLDMSVYATGKTNFEKFEAARDELAARGGGVLYYPAGTYDFSDMPADGPNGRGLMLKSGVVIRGEAPKGSPRAAKSGTLDLPTKFTFGFAKSAEGSRPRDWNLIGLSPAPGKGVKDVDNVGIAWVAMTGAIVYFGPQTGWGKDWRTAGSWKSAQAIGPWGARVPDGTFFMDPFMGGSNKYVGMGSGRLVFGCVLADAAPVNNYRSGAGHMERFAPRMGVYGARVLVANNVLPKSTRNFRYNGVMFDYGDTSGIDVNKDLLGYVRADGKCPGYFVEGVVVRDNWVYNHGHKGYNISGSWVTIAGNHNERDVLKSGDDVYGIGGGWNLTLDGVKAAKQTDDNLARAFDLAGRNLWIDHNTFNNTGSDPGNDGEGILCQLHGGTHLYSWAITRNAYDMQRGEPSYMAAYDVDCFGLLVAWNDIPSGFVGAKVKAPNKLVDIAIIGNRAKKVTPAPGGPTKSKYADQMAGKAYPLCTAPAGKLLAPTEVKAQPHGDSAVMVTWTDPCEIEVAFRVDRKLEGDASWTTIAYRPPHTQGTPENPQAWADYTCPPARPATYRVVAIGDSDNDAGASDATARVTLK